MKKWKSPKELLEYLNTTYLKVHYEFEKNFWLVYMGDKSRDSKKDAAEAAREHFRTSTELSDAISTYLEKAVGPTKDRLAFWKEFFDRYQTPATLVPLRAQISELQTRIETKRSTRVEGYTDPYTNKFVAMSRNAMASLRVTSDDEKVRKACFDALEKLALECADEYVEMVQKRNTYAQTLGYTDFYDFKLAVEEKMTKKELFSLWDAIYEKTKFAFKNIRALEKKKPGLRKPWNFGYMLAGSFIKESDQYFPFENAIPLWIETFSRMGITFNKGTLVLDLLERFGKYNNGFCHWPIPVHYKGAIRTPARSQFTCNVTLGIPGESSNGYNTLFHEGGHAAHFSNSESKDICMNSEYPPMSTAWAETQSMFLDTVGSSVEWLTLYAKNKQGNTYPLDLYIRETQATHVTQPLGLMGIIMISQFERAVYEEKNLTREKLIAIAKQMYQKHTDRSEDSVGLLDVPHIYSWESACSYHGYGLATLALSQWREYFFKKYDYIVDNPHVGKEMKQVWKYGATKSFSELVRIATGKKLSPTAYIKSALMTLPQIEKRAKKRIAIQSQVKQKVVPDAYLDAYIELVHGKQKIADSKKGYKKMTDTYAKWLQTQYKK